MKETRTSVVILVKKMIDLLGFTWCTFITGALQALRSGQQSNVLTEVFFPCNPCKPCKQHA
eukprot:1161455-Pelagomonas_calceolata.AAC.4